MDFNTYYTALVTIFTGEKAAGQFSREILTSLNHDENVIFIMTMLYVDEGTYDPEKDYYLEHFNELEKKYSLLAKLFCIRPWLLLRVLNILDWLPSHTADAVILSAVLGKTLPYPNASGLSVLRMILGAQAAEMVDLHRVQLVALRQEHARLLTENAALYVRIAETGNGSEKEE